MGISVHLYIADGADAELGHVEDALVVGDGVRHSSDHAIVNTYIHICMYEYMYI